MVLAIFTSLCISYSEVEAQNFKCKKSGYQKITTEDGKLAVAYTNSGKYQDDPLSLREASEYHMYMNSKDTFSVLIEGSESVRLSYDKSQILMRNSKGYLFIDLEQSLVNSQMDDRFINLSLFSHEDILICFFRSPKKIKVENSKITIVY